MQGVLGSVVLGWAGRRETAILWRGAQGTLGGRLPISATKAATNVLADRCLCACTIKLPEVELLG